MASNLMSLPLEVKDQIYGYVLSDDHDIFAHGVPALLKTHEYYPYHRQQSLRKISRFENDTRKKALLVVCKSITPPQAVYENIFELRSEEDIFDRAAYTWWQRHFVFSKATLFAEYLASKGANAVVDRECECAFALLPREVRDRAMRAIISG
ncbi:hypothetical protein M438DRAFT_352481 [Aureobasidium pullulans EXF-150]|uniref:Uncharacterized protein n=1 Tax=Aureobasidium pullulans EXF-150 TaxID=1043002 RepID=A0A074Y0H1_AURPU|nr:uncharacterized protein M438DRAFT_352481 [Aureobasidium pullulans EXF-150]KEQ87692.1 hypothetical protein M438DRAFT_352481 [Aureobasidium pullulans EXF-150]